MSLPRARIVAAARAWIGTPYQHQASVRGVGADCLGLVRGLWRELIGPEPEPIPPYAPDWTDRGGAEALHSAFEHWFERVEVAHASPGDVILFRIDAGSPIKHAAVLVSAQTIAHAYWGRAVVESRFSPWWRARVGAAFSFPGAEPWPN